MDELRRVILEYVRREYLEEGDDREALRGLPAVDGRCVGRPTLRRGRRRAIPAPAHGQRDRGPDDREAERRRHERVGEEGRERQPQRLADQHVLRVADEGGRGADVRACGEAEQVRHGVEATPDAAVDEQRGHGEADDVVREDGRQGPGGGHHDRQQGGRPDRRPDEPAGHPRVEAPEAQLRRDDHEAEEERERRHVDRLPGRRRRDALGRDEGEGAEEGDAGAVEGEAGELPEQHPEIDGGEDPEDEGVRPASGHGAARGGAAPPRGCRRPCRTRSGRGAARGRCG